jgi:hypothetical protein
MVLLLRRENLGFSCTLLEGRAGIGSGIVLLLYIPGADARSATLLLADTEPGYVHRLLSYYHMMKALF